jgi:glycosyltransferase involved in cell wall biosynthesis
MKASLKIVSLVEATTMNAVARIVLEFLRTARELKDEVAIDGSVVTFARGGVQNKANEMERTFLDAGIEVVTIPERHRFDVGVVSGLSALFDDLAPPDIIVTHSVKSHFLMWRSRLWKKYPWVAFHHGYTSTDLKMLAYNRLDRLSLPKADRVAAVCHAFARELAKSTKIPEEKIFVQHNAIRPQPKPGDDQVSELRRHVGMAADDRLIISIGRLSKEKAHGDLIEAFRLLGTTNPNSGCRLVIVGDGPERAGLEEAARASGQNDRITFAGQVSNVQPFYAAADVFVLPSLSEGSPNVLLEAMAAEVPIVATAVGGVTEIVADEESSLLVPPKNPPALAAAIDRVLQDSALAQRLTTVASALAAREHSPEAYARSLISLYREVIEQRAAES